MAELTIKEIMDQVFKEKYGVGFDYACKAVREKLIIKNIKKQESVVKMNKILEIKEVENLQLKSIQNTSSGVTECDGYQVTTEQGDLYILIDNVYGHEIYILKYGKCILKSSL